MRSLPKSRVTDLVYKVEGVRTQGSVCPIATGSSEQDPVFKIQAHAQISYLTHSTQCFPRVCISVIPTRQPEPIRIPHAQQQVIFHAVQVDLPPPPNSLIGLTRPFLVNNRLLLNKQAQFAPDSTPENFLLSQSFGPCDYGK